MDSRRLLALHLTVARAAVIPLPDGASTHGQPNLLCKPADGYTVLAFFLSNYVTHAASTQTFTTQALSIQCLDVLTSFMLPTAQISKIIHNISRGIVETFSHKHGMDSTKWTVVRKEGWTPVDGHEHPGIQYVLFWLAAMSLTGTTKEVTAHRTMLVSGAHGSCRAHPGRQQRDCIRQPTTTFPSFHQDMAMHASPPTRS